MGYWGRGVLLTIAIGNTFVFLTVVEDVPAGLLALLTGGLVFAWVLGFYFDKVKYTSEKDVLTGVYNRRIASKVFHRLRRQASRKDSLLAVFVVDINNFKAINDTFNHDTGDKVLQLVSDLLIAVFRTPKHVIRWGGDEFIVIHTFRSSEELRRTHDILHQETDSLSGKMTFDISLSAGFSLFPRDGDQLDLLISRADKAMYSNKSAMKREARSD
ncbi:GGDEF domain-containing protein [Paenibacillus thalictri]|uniref:GGDEF domain-containing protein n=1 Tax=Paenibacillus thalictri TaxID=2527873 RepID=A0A4Q9DWG9_9BACL|nr:GGDEF domain-containing protein [Paenibacillus thalictri]TBL79511.1 GGDEF domain-containing protein [Paenibacillus thalictri]